MKNIKVIGFDADDTLWMNENYYRNTEEKYAELLSEFGKKEYILSELFNTEMQNLKIFGYGVKPFVISMIENAIRISEGRVEQSIITEIIRMGKVMLDEPVVLLPGVKEVLDKLHGHCRLIVATKGDILDQERKLKRSSLSGYFHHIEVMSDKTPETYKELLNHLEIEPEHFVMIGNSLRSDILAPYELGSYTIHIPYEMTWQHEMDVEEPPLGDRFKKVESIREILQFFNCD
jgi:putative hydrolase of the HAD superfamily